MDVQFVPVPIAGLLSAAWVIPCQGSAILPEPAGLWRHRPLLPISTMVVHLTLTQITMVRFHHRQLPCDRLIEDAVYIQAL